MPQSNFGLVNAYEAYSKREVLTRLGISQKFWDKMISSGLPTCMIGQARWVSGAALLAYIERMSASKAADIPTATYADNAAEHRN